MFTIETPSYSDYLCKVVLGEKHPMPISAACSQRAFATQLDRCFQKCHSCVNTKGTCVMGHSPIMLPSNFHGWRFLVMTPEHFLEEAGVVTSFTAMKASSTPHTRHDTL